MTYTISTADGTTRVAIRGELDAVSVAELRPDIDGLVNKKPRSVAVDLSGLRMIDSSGVGALVSLYKRVRAQGGQVVVVGLQDQPLAIFRLLRLDRVMAGPGPVGGLTPPPTAEGKDGKDGKDGKESKSNPKRAG